MRAREEEVNGKQIPEPVLDERSLAFDVRPAVSAELPPTRAHATAKQLPTRAMPQSPRNMDLQCLRAVMMERSHPSR
jgi:hypothetical protein